MNAELGGSEMGGFAAIERWWQRGGGVRQSFRSDLGLDHVGPCKPSAYLELYFKNQGKKKMNKPWAFWEPGHRELNRV